MHPHSYRKRERQTHKWGELHHIIIVVIGKKGHPSTRREESGPCLPPSLPASLPRGLLTQLLDPPGRSTAPHIAAARWRRQKSAYRMVFRRCVLDGVLKVCIGWCSKDRKGGRMLVRTRRQSLRGTPPPHLSPSLPPSLPPLPDKLMFGCPLESGLRSASPRPRHRYRPGPSVRHRGKGRKGGSGTHGLIVGLFSCSTMRPHLHPQCLAGQESYSLLCRKAFLLLPLPPLLHLLQPSRLRLSLGKKRGGGV